MFKLKNLSNSTETVVTPTIFNDKTSQCWKLPENVLIRSSKFKIVWYFESEAEVIQLLQLSNLLHNTGEVVELFIPYFPYARQDKRISNESTFAQETILTLLETYFECGITVFDLHNPSICATRNVFNITPEKYIVKSMIDARTDLVCYPDAGASKRYGELADFIVSEKSRDQATGEILGHKLLESKHDLEGRTVMVVDDIADGSATFISMAKMLKEKGVANIDLYVSHGIFSKGLHIVKHAGIRNIYTTDSYIGSSEMTRSLITQIYKVEE